MLVKDAGFRGAAICLTEGSADIRIEKDLGVAQAGAQSQVFSRRCQREGRTGFEFACGIPGTIGGAVRGNAGAWGGQTFDRLVEVTCLDARTGATTTLTGSEVEHGYRHVALDDSLIVLEAAFALDEDDPDAIQRRMDRMLAERKASQPVWMRNAGCVFKNPPGTSAGLLIDRTGCKGLSVGNVEVSQVHANFIVTKGGTTAAEVLRLIDEVRARVRRAEGVDLDTEVRIIGEHGIENV
jgi:UDP-N-acetylmuramate dehydrogenase